LWPIKGIRPLHVTLHKEGGVSSPLRKNSDIWGHKTTDLRALTITEERRKGGAPREGKPFDGGVWELEISCVEGRGEREAGRTGILKGSRELSVWQRLQQSAGLLQRRVRPKRLSKKQSTQFPKICQELSGIPKKGESKGGHLLKGKRSTSEKKRLWTGSRADAMTKL